jgi:hypothetical protein
MVDELPEEKARLFHVPFDRVNVRRGWKTVRAQPEEEEAFFFAALLLPLGESFFVSFDSVPDRVEEPLWYPSEYQPPPLSRNEVRETSFSSRPEQLRHLRNGPSPTFCITSVISPHFRQRYS